MKFLWRLAGCSSRKAPYRWIIGAGLAAILGVAAGRNFLKSVCYVSGTSMVPTFNPGACLFTTPISGPLERGDVVMIDDGFAGYAIKRIVGMPGETVQLWRGQVFINRQAIIEPYIPRNIYTYAKPKRWTCILGQNQYYVMGDNRLKSVDSRIYGPVNRNKIKREVPLPANSPRAQFAPYLMPDGGVLPRPIVSKSVNLSIF
jgi:signal peptidase I